MLGSRPPIFDREKYREKNVKENHEKERSSNHPEYRSEVAEMLGITIDPFRPEKDLQIAEQMADNESNQDDPRCRDYKFSSDGRAVEGRNHARWRWTLRDSGRRSGVDLSFGVRHGNKSFAIDCRASGLDATEKFF